MKTNATDKDELHATIKKLKKGRSSNDIPTEYIQAASEINGFLEEREKLYRTFWENLAIPTSWGNSILHVVFFISKWILGVRVDFAKQNPNFRVTFA